MTTGEGGRSPTSSSGTRAISVSTLYPSILVVAALTLVRWPSSSDLGAVVSEIDRGRIDREVHFDLGSSPEQILRALPATIGTYEDLYAAHAVDAIADLFTADAAYRYNPWHEPIKGHETIVADWLSDRDAPGN